MSGVFEVAGQTLSHSVDRAQQQALSALQCSSGLSGWKHFVEKNNRGGILGCLVCKAGLILRGGGLFRRVSQNGKQRRSRRIQSPVPEARSGAENQQMLRRCFGEFCGASLRILRIYVLWPGASLLWSVFSDRKPLLSGTNPRSVRIFAFLNNRSGST